MIKKVDKAKLNIVFRYLIATLEIITVIAILMIRTAFMADVFYVALIPICGSCFILILTDFNVLDYVIKNKSKGIVAAITSTIFFMLLSAEQTLKSIMGMNNELTCIVVKILFVPVLILSVFILVCYIFYISWSGNCIQDNSTVANTSDKNLIFLHIMKPMWIIIIVALVFFLAYFPGDVCADIPFDILTKEHVLSDWHTLGWEYFVRIFAYIPKSLTVLVVAQMLFLLLAHNAVMKLLYNRFKNVGILYLYAILNVTVGFMQFRYMVNMCKDTNFVFSILIFTVALLTVINKDKLNKRDWIALVTSAVLASLFRHMCFPIVIFTLFIFMMFTIVKNFRNGVFLKSNIIFSGSAIIVVICAYLLLVDFIGFGLLKSERNPDYVKYTVPMNMVGAMAYRNAEVGESIPDNIKASMEEIMPLEKWIDCYCPFDADVIARPWQKVGEDIRKLDDKYYQGLLIKLNWYFLTHNTKAYIISFFDINSIVWEMAKPNDEVIYSVVSQDRPEFFHMRKGGAFYFTEDTVNYALSRPIISAITLRGGIGLFLLLLAGIILVMKKSSDIVALIPLYIYISGTMISIPQSNSRYAMPIIVFSIFWIIYAINARNEYKADGE